MDEDENEQQLLLNSSQHTNNLTTTEETPLVDHQPYDEGERASAISLILDWNTSILCEICREGDILHLAQFIDYSRQTHSCDEHASELADRVDSETGLSPLHHAARYQQLHICLMLLSNIKFELGVNIKDANDRTPIHSAFRSSNNLNINNSNPEKQFDIETHFGEKLQTKEIWQEEYKNQLLLNDHPLIYLFAKAKGNLNARDKYLLTPLHYAVARNNLSGVKQLIILNADIESRDRQGIRPLHLACKEGYLSIVEYLIEHDAKINAIDNDKWTPLHYACAKGHLDIIKFIQSKENLNFEKFIQMKTNINATCLHLSVQNGNIHLVEYILTQFNNDTLKILINEQTEPFGTPLHIAARFCDPSMIKFLYDHGADPLIRNSQDQSLLHIASSSNRLSIVKEIFSLTQTSLLEIKDNRGQTALSVTTYLDIVNELITYGANILSLDKNHMNVLMIAVLNEQISIVEYLLFVINDQLISIFNQVTKRNNRSIFLIAIQTGSIDMCSLLLTHPCVRWDTIDKQRMNAFHIAARNNHHKLIEYLSEYIRNSDKFQSFKSRSYSFAATMIDSDLINIPQAPPILRLYIDAQNEDGKTPLHIAAEHGHQLSIESLIKSGADILQPTYLGQLPLHIAIQNGHSQCVDLLLKASIRHITDFQFALSRRQSPLITACQNGFVDIVRLLLSQEIGIHHNINYNQEEENPLEIAIKYQQIEIIHVLLEHPHTEYWLMPIRKTKEYYHQTPLRTMIRYIPECAKHAFDKFILKTNEIDENGKTIERIIYNYKYIDDYFMDNGKLYDTNSHKLYRNHPFIIALDSEHHSLLEHPLAQQLMLRKWKLYRPLFYLARILAVLLLLMLTFFVLIIPAPNKDLSINKNLLLYNRFILSIQWIIVSLAGMNLFKIILEIILYGGLRVPFAQLFSIISFLTSIIAFIPYDKTNKMIYWQWQLAAFSTLFQWFNIAFVLRSVPFIGNIILMIESVLIKCLSLIFILIPLLIAFTIAKQMIFYNHSSFVTVMLSVHKLTAMIIGEFDFETLFFSKPIFTAATLLFIPFIVIMTIVFMNLLLGVTVGDIHSCMENAQAKANAYRTRELIYIESVLPSIKWLKSNIIENEIIDNSSKDSKLIKTNDEDEEDNEFLSNRQNVVELKKLLDILNILCTQAKQVLEKEISLETILKQLLAIRKVQVSMEPDSDGFSTSR